MAGRLRICYNEVVKRAVNGFSYCSAGSGHHRTLFCGKTVLRCSLLKVLQPSCRDLGRRHYTISSQFLQVERQIGNCTLTGRRNKNEDTFSIARLPSGFNIFGVFDGHRGSFAAKYLRENLPTYIEECLSEAQTSSTKQQINTESGENFWSYEDKVIEQILDNAFEVCQRRLKDEIEKRDERGRLVGTTAVVALAGNGASLTIAHVGDSKAILCRSGETLTLTDDHTPNSEEEADRILSMKGWIDWDTRIFPLVNGQLQMTRSLGDIHLKNYGVISKPTIKHIQINQETDAFLVLCSDGVTHTISDDEITHIVSQHDCPNKAAETLACSAQQYGSTDDVTCLVIPLPAWEKAKKMPTKKGFSHFRMALGFRGDG